MARPAAVFFDVDFTLIHPGPRFQGSGYQDCCARHGVSVDALRFDAAVAGASGILDAESAQEYDADLYMKYTRRIIALMGGDGHGADRAARELYDAWAEHHHFSLYDDVVGTLGTLHGMGMRIGLISNSNRCLASFQSHFELEGLIAVTVSGPHHGFMKPHPSLFEAALRLMDVPAASAVMVGDSLSQDVHGARRVGMIGVLLARDGAAVPDDPEIPVIRSLRELTDESLFR